MARLTKYRPADLWDWDSVLDRFFDDTPMALERSPAVDVREDEKEDTMEVEVPCRRSCLTRRLT